MPSTVLITGCSTGFGLASAALFLARGWNVVATMRSPKPMPFEDSDRLLVTALDVTDPEPLPASSPLFDLPNVLLTPHVAGSLGNEVARLGEAAVAEIERLAAGLPLAHAVTFADFEQMA